MIDIVNVYYCSTCGEELAYEDAECWYCEIKAELLDMQTTIDDLKQENNMLRKSAPDEEMIKNIRTALMLAHDRLDEKVGLFDNPSERVIAQERRLIQLGEWLYELGCEDE